MIYGYIITMAVVTYLIRMLPLTIFQKKIENKFMQSFLYYVPYACLMAMTFPTVFHSTGNLWSALAGVGIAIVMALFEKSLAMVALFSCVGVYLVNLLLTYL